MIINHLSKNDKLKSIKLTDEQIIKRKNIDPMGLFYLGENKRVDIIIVNNGVYYYGRKHHFGTKSYQKIY